MKGKNVTKAVMFLDVADLKVYGKNLKQKVQNF
jgi:hypothetical protein